MVIRSEVNLGFGRANNLGFQSVRGRYAVLLNSDAFLTPGSLELSVAHIEANPRIGIGGGRLVGSDGSLQPSARMFPTVLNDLIVLSGLAARFPHSRFFGRFDRTWADEHEAAEVDWVPGAYSIIRREVLAEVGLLRSAILPLLRRGGSVPAHKAERIFGLVLAGCQDRSHRRRVVPPDPVTRDVQSRRATYPLAHEKHVALLPQTSWHGRALCHAYGASVVLAPVAEEKAEPRSGTPRQSPD